MTQHLMTHELLPACEGAPDPDGFTHMAGRDLDVDCSDCLRGTWYRYENGEVHDRDDRYGDTGPSCELVQMHNTWSVNCTVPTAERPNGDGLDFSAICPTCEPDGFAVYGLWGG